MYAEIEEEVLGGLELEEGDDLRAEKLPVTPEYTCERTVRCCLKTTDRSGSPNLMPYPYRHPSTELS